MPDVHLSYNSVDYRNEISSEGGSVEMTSSPVGDTLSADSMIVPLIGGGGITRILAADQDENDFIYTADGKILCAGDGFVVPVLHKNMPGYLYSDDQLILKHFIYQIEQLTKYSYRATYYSAIWLLEQSYHVGGIYTGETVGELLVEIIGNIVSYTVDDDIAAIQVYGWLPYAKRRENLQKLKMAIGAAIKNAADGSLHITSFSDVVAGDFTGRIYLGGKPIDKTPCSAVQVTEHNFFEVDEEVVLYEDSSVQEETIVFPEPVHDLYTENCTVLEQSVNHIKFIGDGNVLVKGKKYLHVKRIITHGTVPANNSDDVVKRVDDNTLISPFNSVEVAKNLYDYFSIPKAIQLEVDVGYERPGDIVTIQHPYTDEIMTAFIQSMNITFVSASIKAVCEFLPNYTPPGATKGFENYVLLTGSGNWTVPEDVTLIRVVIVGAGQGGQRGYNGATPASLNVGGAGGAPGLAGQSGRVFVINLAVEPETQIPYDAKSGTPGATTTGVTPALPDPTTFGDYNSNMGRHYPSGYFEPKTGLTFANSSPDGVKGGDGADPGEWEGESVTFQGQTWLGGNSYPLNLAGGGGAAVGANGGHAHDDPPGQRAGDGGSAIPGVDATNYGQGGGGGHGGGGGGYHPTTLSRRGTGGLGSRGGDGFEGCIVIYY